jgi:formylglycine-generating enzyme required for sulfatase activity
MTTDPLPSGNPYVGPRPFEEADARDGRYYGREREARDLLALVARERLVLFYAQSGAGKSSLLRASLIPGLRDLGFDVLPVARVSGAAPGIADPGVANIFVYDLILSVNEGLPVGERAPAEALVKATLAEFLGGEAAGDPDAAAGLAPTVLLVDQFEEIVTSRPERWQDRAAFFEQLRDALERLPRLWVVLTLREDFVAPLEPCAELLPNRLRARYYMQRMGQDAALEAVRRPALTYGLPFAAGVAETLVDNLRRVRVQFRDEPQLGEYVEPVQLQVVCYELWQKLRALPGPTPTGGREQHVPASPGEVAGGEAEEKVITEADLALGHIDQALTHFYEDALAEVLKDPAAQAAGTDERRLRTWFDKELITAEGIRNAVARNEQTGRTGSLANAAVDRLDRRYLVRTELRAGGAWVELVHDRFVEPIRASNAAWFPQHLSALQRQAALWDEQGRSSGLLLRDAALVEAEAWAAASPKELQSDEQEFLAACRQAQAAVEREQRQSRRIRMLAVAAFVIGILAIGAAVVAEDRTQRALRAEQRAVEAQAIAEENATLANQQLELLAVEQLLQQARDLKAQGNGKTAIAALEEAATRDSKMTDEIDKEITDVRRQVATRLVEAGEQLAAAGDHTTAFAKFEEALSLDPPPDTPIYVWIPAGWFMMGSRSTDDRAYPDQQPQHRVWADDFWIQRTEVTNAQYGKCVRSKACEPPHNEYWDKQQYANIPVTHVDWFQANAYARWVGGRLPTEAEWEKACRGDDSRIYSWGNDPLSPTLTNFSGSGFPLPSVVGSYAAGAYGLYDMSGNVWEWTSSLDKPYPYTADDGRENQEDLGNRVLRGGAFNHEGDFDLGVSCTVRGRGGPSGLGGYYGFRVVVAPGS